MKRLATLFALTLCASALVPAPVLEDCRNKAAQWVAEKHGKPRNWLGAAIIIVMWIAAAWLAWALYHRWFIA